MGRGTRRRSVRWIQDYSTERQGKDEVLREDFVDGKMETCPESRPITSPP